MRRARYGALVAGGLLAVGVLAGCGSSSGSPAAGASERPSRVAATSSSPPAATGSITVFAAASLKKVFGQEAAAFQEANPDASVTFSFAGSQQLVAQLSQGAPADVLATADQQTMQKVGDAVNPRVFAHNKLLIVVQQGNPKHITGLADLARSGISVVLAGDTVPAGKYARQALSRAKLDVKPVTTTTDVTTVVTDVRLGQADAGIVYVTDIDGVPGVQGVPIADAQNIVATYPVATLRGAKNAATADAWDAFLLSDAGQAILTKAGFGAA